jgi:hypothetical protein
VARTKLRMVVDEATGTPFYFGYDRADPQRLHVEVRGQSIQAAIDAYFDATTTIWNSDHRRWESQAAGVGIYWTYLNNQPGHILIISCFDVEE